MDYYPDEGVTDTMDREKKGSSADGYKRDYCVLDLETTSVYLKSARIIEIGIIRVRNEQVVKEFNELINPGIPIPFGATMINHISDKMVENAPSIDEVIDNVIDFIGDDVVVGYNNASYDMNLLYDNCIQLRGYPLANNYIDILHATRRCLNKVDNYKLETICKYYSINTTGEHRALKDCYLTKDCYEKLYSEFGDAAFVGKGKAGGNGTRHIQYTPETRALQELHVLVQEIIEDGVITESELYALSSWVENHIELQGNYPFDRIFNALDKVLEDGKVSLEELEELKALFIDFVDPVKSRCCHDTICTLFGKHVCITGDFEYGSRNDVFALIEKAGGIIDKNIKKATDYIVIGVKGSESWKTGNYGSKIQKAVELNEKGSDIKFVEEADFIPAVKIIIGNGGIPDAETEDSKDLDWKQDVRAMLDDLVSEYELPEGSLYLSDNKGQTEKTKDKLISHSVCIWEPDFPPMKNERRGQNKLVMTIVPSTVQSRPDDLDLNLRELQEGDLHQYLPEDAESLKRTKSDISTGTVRIRMKKNSPNLVEYIKQNTIYCIKGYVSKAARFGCCSQFIKCSDAKKCLHANKLYSKACIYRDNLEHGRIFYGKNRNIGD